MAIGLLRSKANVSYWRRTARVFETSATTPLWRYCWVAGYAGQN
ncbi:MAG: hypothetical protein ABSB30_00740 [Terracidiphilus sp.]